MFKKDDKSPFILIGYSYHPQTTIGNQVRANRDAKHRCVIDDIFHSDRDLKNTDILGRCMNIAFLGSSRLVSAEIEAKNSDIRVNS